MMNSTPSGAKKHHKSTN